MEALSLNEQRSSLRWAQRTPRRYRSPRLPTPEASRSSNEAFELPGDITASRRDPPIHELLLRRSPDKALRSLQGPPTDGHTSRHYGGRHSEPHSPPYRMTDSQKPSLPPLKMVFGDNLSSPPQTPTTLASSFQPSPCEPAYTTATYKPPSLYPNKKQRTGPLQEPASLTQTVSSFSSPGLASAAFDPRHAGQSQAYHFASAPEAHHLRRASAQLPSNSSYATHNVTTSSRTDGTSVVAGHASYSTPAQTPTSATPGRPYSVSSICRDTPADYALGAQQHAYFDHPPGQLASRRSSIDPYNEQPNGSLDSNYARHSSFTPGPRIPFSPKHELGLRAEERRRLEYAQSHAFPTFSQGSCESTQPSFFMPSSYEYQHGKARKRSNLPKQSTEIMKTWFDQNITNPYPSEEQKSMFSNATGISMTQVSNWFINHRRRCPELRDKREKSRGNGRDGDL